MSRISIILINFYVFALQTSCVMHGHRRADAQIKQVDADVSTIAAAVDQTAYEVDPQGYLITEGDILVVRENQGLMLSGAIRKQTADLWPHATVYYRYDDRQLDDPDAQIRKKRQERKFVEAAQVWSQGVNSYLEAMGSRVRLRFVEDRAKIQPNYLQLLGDEAINSSYVGMIGGAQEFRLREKATHRAIRHEIGHALGLPHEHTRCDRNNYVAILKDNITEGKQDNFKRACKKYRIVLDDYDVNSIMHYSSDAYSRNGEPTIVLKDDPSKRWEQPEVPSALDFKTIAIAYDELAPAAD